MEPFAPFQRDRRVAVAVSGGADSMALALLLSRWGRPEAFIVNHGLRAESAAEALLARQELARFGVPSRTLLLHLQSGPGLGERARLARYAALSSACAAAGLVDLLLGHHAQDQAETFLLREARGSGPAGLAAMASILHTHGVRLLRPLLPATPNRLRATLQHAGIAWSEDPGNHDPSSPRGALRRRFRAMGPGYALAHAGSARLAGVRRNGAERADLAQLAATATLYPEGFAYLQGAVLPSALVWAVSGRSHPPSPASVGRRMSPIRPGTLHGVIVAPAGKLGPGWIVAREVAGGPVPALHGAMWDGRFRLSGRPPPGTVIAALGAVPAVRAFSDLPSIVLRTLPALWRDDALVAVPQLGYPSSAACEGLAFSFEPGRPAGPAPFVHMPHGRGCEG